MRLDRPALQLSLGICILLGAGCEAMIPYNWDSAEKEGERVAIVLETASAQEAQPMEVVVPREGRRLKLQVDPTFVEARLSKLVARAAATSTRAPASWSAATAGDFYAAPPRLLDAKAGQAEMVRVEVRPGVRGFRIERWLFSDRVTSIEFSLEPRDDAFRVTLDRITITESRAKVADKSWTNFWTRIPLLYGFAFDIARIFGVVYGDDAVDVRVDLSFSASWTDARGETRFAPLSVLGWTVLDVQLDEKPREVGQSSGWLPMPPASVRVGPDGELSFGRGHFSLWALVTEQDDLSQELIEDRNTLGTYLDDLLGLLPGPRPLI